MRVIGLDYGSKTVGVALSDELMEKMKNAMKDILDQFKLLKGVN